LFFCGCKYTQTSAPVQKNLEISAPLLNLLSPLKNRSKSLFFFKTPIGGDKNSNCRRMKLQLSENDTPIGVLNDSLVLRDLRQFKTQ
jgi:hypothetical protein